MHGESCTDAPDPRRPGRGGHRSAPGLRADLRRWWGPHRRCAPAALGRRVRVRPAVGAGVRRRRRRSRCGRVRRHLLRLHHGHGARQPPSGPGRHVGQSPVGLAELHRPHYGSTALPTVPAWEAVNTQTSPGVFSFDNHWVMFYDAAQAGHASDTGYDCLSVATAAAISPTDAAFTDDSTGPLLCQSALGGAIDPSPVHRSGRRLAVVGVEVQRRRLVAAGPHLDRGARQHRHRVPRRHLPDADLRQRHGGLPVGVHGGRSLHARRRWPVLPAVQRGDLHLVGATRRAMPSAPRPPARAPRPTPTPSCRPTARWPVRAGARGSPTRRVISGSTTPPGPAGAPATPAAAPAGCS